MKLLATALVSSSSLVAVAPAQNAAGVEQRLADLERRVAESGKFGRGGWDDGFFLESADGRSRLNVSMLLQTLGTVHESDAQRLDEFDLQRMRVAFEGELYGRYLFSVEPQYQPDGVDLAEAWVGARLCEDSLFMAGRAKVPFSLEEMVPRRHIDFVNFSTLNQFAPAEDHGLVVRGRTLENHLEYGLSATNGTAGDENNDQKELGARAVWHVFGNETARELQFGIAGTTGRAFADLDGVEIENETKQVVTAFEPGTELDGTRTRVAVEGAWLDGPFGIYGEWMRIDQDLANGANAREVGLEGFWIAGTWVLTGESKRFSGVRPGHPFVPGGDGNGAWQLALRYSQLDLGDEFVSLGAISPTAFPESISTLDVGLNWHMTNHSKLRMHVVHTTYDERIDVGSQRVSEETALVVQYQFNL